MALQANVNVFMKRKYAQRKHASHLFSTHEAFLRNDLL